MFRNKRGLRVTSAYMLDDHKGSFPTIHECDFEDQEVDNKFEEKNFKSKPDPDRRHTLGVVGDWEEYTTNQENTKEAEWAAKNKKNEILFEFLRRRYPEYSHIIDKKMASDTIIIPFTNGFAETDLDDTMSEADTSATGGFQRGGRARSSLPIVRHHINKSKEKSLGLIYLMYMGETKRALMPNEITGIDTVRALYVRSFPGKLSMQMMESPERKVYIRDPLTEIFYELENTNEIRDRSVLKIYEPGYIETADDNKIRSTSSTPVDMNYHSEPEVDQARAEMKQRRYHTMNVPRITASEADLVMSEKRVRTSSEGQRDTHPHQPKQNASRTTSAAVEQRTQPPPQQRQHQEQFFRRGVPERATVGGTVPQRTPNNQAFQRGVPQRSSATVPRNVPQQSGANMQHHQQRGSATTQRRGPPPPQSGQGKQTIQQQQRPIQSGSKTLPHGTTSQPHQHPRGSQTPQPSRAHAQRQGSGPPHSTQLTRRNPEREQRHSPYVGHYGSPRRTQHAKVPPGLSFAGQRSQPDLRTFQQTGSAIPNGQMNDDENTRKIEAMEKQIANLAGMVRTALTNGKGPNGQPEVQRSQSTQLYSTQRPQTQPVQRSHSSQRQPSNYKEVKKVDIKPAEIEIIKPTGEPSTPNIGYFDSKTATDDRSDLKTTSISTTRQAILSPRSRRRAILVVKGHLRDLKEQQRNVRQMHMNMMHQMNNNFKNTSMKIKQVLDHRPPDLKPSAFDHPIRTKRSRVQQKINRYKQNKLRINKDLNNLEGKVEGIRTQTLNSRNQVSSAEVDHLAKSLNNNSKLIAEQKAIFPEISDELKAVMEGEMEVVVYEENFIRDEPGELDDYYRRCKNLTGTLYTLKRLAQVQVQKGGKESEIQKSASLSVLHSQPKPMNSVKENIPCHDLKKRFANPAERLRFEHSLLEGKRKLRTTLYTQNATLRRRKNLLDLYKQDTHDQLTPIMTQEKEARREAAKKKGPPPPPPPRRTTSTTKTNISYPTPASVQITKTRIIDTAPLTDGEKSKAVTKKMQIEIQGQQPSSQRMDEITQALDELENFALRAGDMADMEEERSKGGYHNTVPRL